MGLVDIFITKYESKEDTQNETDIDDVKRVQEETVNSSRENEIINKLIDIQNCIRDLEMLNIQKNIQNCKFSMFNDMRYGFMGRDVVQSNVLADRSLLI